MLWNIATVRFSYQTRQLKGLSVFMAFLFGCGDIVQQIDPSLEANGASLRFSVYAAISL